MELLADEKKIPHNFAYPGALLKLIECNLVNYDVWYIMDSKSAEIRYNGLHSRYPTRELIPFARRCDCDDVACFEVGHGEEVFIIHDFASCGYEQKGCFKSIWDWLRYVIDAMIEYEILSGIV